MNSFNCYTLRVKTFSFTLKNVILVTCLFLLSFLVILALFYSLAVAMRLHSSCTSLGAMDIIRLLQLSALSYGNIKELFVAVVQCFPTFWPVTENRTPKFGRYPRPSMTHEQQYFSQKCPFILVAHLLKGDKWCTIIIIFLTVVIN